MKRRRTYRSVASSAAMALAAMALVALTGPSARAAANDQNVSGTASPMWQTNNIVDKVAVANGVIYAGGRFTRVRPPGAAAGTQETARTYLAAFNSSTGALITSFNVNLNNRVYDLAVSRDGTKLYIVGLFTTVNGTARQRVAAINLPSGTLDTSFVANANNLTTAVGVSASRVYVSGNFTAVNGVSKPKIASLSLTTGAVDTGFTLTLIPSAPTTDNPNPDPHALAIQVPNDNSRVIVGGDFSGANGVSAGAVASVDPATGALRTWKANTNQPIDTNCGGRVSDIDISGSTAYVTAIGDPPGCYEGTYSAQVSDGTLNWNSKCLGASQGITVMNGILYKGSHQHDCGFNSGGPAGGFVGGTSRDGFIHHHLVAQNATTGGFVHWTPQTNSSGTTHVGPLAMANDGSRVIVAGDFTTVNGRGQQGLARFASAGNTATPNVPGINIRSDPFAGSTPRVVSILAVTAQGTAANTLTVEIPTVEDVDSGTLTYRLYRDAGTNPIATLSAESYPWSRPVLRYDDKGLVAGSTHSYRVSASDGTFTSARSSAVSGTVASSAPAAYPSVIGAQNPDLYWRLSDSGSTAADSSPAGTHPGTYRGGLTHAASGALTGDGSAALDGSSGYVSSSSRLTEPGAFTEAAWFRTTTTSGGLIVGQSDQQAGAGGNTDRVIAMDNNGGLVFAMKAGSSGPFGVGTINVRNQSPIWNDGKWHLAVGTYDGNGTASLYVDGWLQGTATGTPFDPTAKANGLPTSYQRAGYADLSQIQLVFGINFYNNRWPMSDFFDGSLDEVSSYGRALSQAQVSSMFNAGVGGGA